MAKKKPTKNTKSNKERVVWGTGEYAKKSGQLRKQVGKVKSIHDYEKYILKG
jgi:hypothetical protein